MDLFGKKRIKELSAELDCTYKANARAYKAKLELSSEIMDYQAKLANSESQVETLSKLLVEERNKVNVYRESCFEELYETYIDRICEWADKHGLNYVTDKQVIKLQEEVGELAEAHNKRHDDDLKDSLGDIFVVITIIAYQHGWNIEDLIAAAYNVIKDREGKTDNGTFIKDEDIKDADN